MNFLDRIRRRKSKDEVFQGKNEEQVGRQLQDFQSRIKFRHFNIAILTVFPYLALVHSSYLSNQFLASWTINLNHHQIID